MEGARQGAERMLWKVGEVLREVRGQCYSGYGSEGSEESEGVDGMILRLGIKNQFTFSSVDD